MGFEGDLQLDQNNIEENKNLRSAFKALANSMLGKFSQKSDFPQTIYVKSQQEIDEAFQEEEILDVTPLNDDICELQIIPPAKKLNPNSNCIIGAFVTALARVHLYKELKKLNDIPKYRLFYADTDSIIFSSPRTEPLPLICSPCLGDYKKELGPNSSITQFSCLGRKNYSISYYDKDTAKTVTKVSGLSLISKKANESFSAKKFRDLLQQRRQDIYEEVSVPQLRKFMFINDNKITKKVLNFRINNSIQIQRVVDADLSELTKPFGYK